MLLDEDPAALIQECIDNFSIHSDRSALTRISTSISTLSTHRTHTLTSSTTTLKRLQRHQTTLQHNHILSVTQHDPAEHAARILGLDKEKFRVAKEASDAEIEGERLEGELGVLERGLKDLENGGRSAVGRGEVWASEGGEEGLQDVLRLRLYRSLGVEMERAETVGRVRRAVVKNAKKGGTRVVELEAGDSGATNRLWDAM